MFNFIMNNNLNSPNFLISIQYYFVSVLHMDNIPTWLAITISIAIGLVVAIIVQLVIVPWQRRKIIGRTTGEPVKFTINDSTESTPSGSPKRNRRPASFVTDGTPLPAITEQTELASFNNLSGLAPSLYTNKIFDKNGDLNEMKKINGLANNSGNYKIDLKIIQKAENLLGKASLDNTDLTITSLNFIDEQHQHHQQQHSHPNGGVVTENGCKILQEFFDPNRMPPNSTKG